MSLAGALETAAEALPEQADAIRPANGDPQRLLAALAPEAAGRVLTWLLAHAPEEGAELAEDWLEQEAGRAAILAADEQAVAKAGRKALRRLRHELRSRGIAVAEPAPRSVVASLPSVEDSFEAGLVTAPDPLGMRLAYLVEPDPSGGARLFEIAFDDARGVLELRVYSAGRSRVRAFLREVGSRARTAAVPAPPDAVRALVARAAARQAPERRPPPEFAEWRSHVAGAPPGAATPGELAAEALGEEPSPERLRVAEARVRSGELGPWPASLEILRPIAERVRERAGSRLLTNEAQRREQGEAALAESLGSLFGGEGGRVAADRLRDSAYVLWKQDDEAGARACLAAAAAFGTLAPGENPVARALLEVALAPLFEALGEAEASSLVARP